MQRPARPYALYLAALILCATAVLQPGCVKVKQTLTVMPDGSGKVELSFGLSEKLVEAAKDSDDDPFKQVLPHVIHEKGKGIVGFTEPVRETAEGFQTLRYTGYFRDINEVRISGLGEGKPARYRFVREGESATLTVSHGTTLSYLADYEPTPENEKQATREAMAGLALVERFVMPGEVSASQGLDVKDNTATLSVTLDEMLEGTGSVAKLKGKNTITIRVENLDTDREVLDAFKAELKQVAEAWRSKQRDQQRKP